MTLVFGLVTWSWAAGADGVVAASAGDVARKAPECAPLFEGASGTAAPITNLWEAAKTPALASHCHRLQQGVNAFRDQKYAAALELAQKAELDTAGEAGPWVVRGEANARWGKPGDAVAAFEKARACNTRALDDAETLDDYGAALLQLGRLDDARRIYRALLPRVGGPQGLCGMKTECDAAGLAYMTAGALALEGGPKEIDEAIAILREARNKSEPGRDVRRVAALALALALDRRGDVDQGKELAGEIAKTKGVPSEVSSEIVARLVAPEEATAMRAMGLEQTDRPAALLAWRCYLSSGGDKRAWAAHAREHVARLEKSENASLKKAPLPSSR